MILLPYAITNRDSIEFVYKVIPTQDGASRRARSGPGPGSASLSRS